jgi:hypothetical protein
MTPPSGIVPCTGRRVDEDIASAATWRFNQPGRTAKVRYV